MQPAAHCKKFRLTLWRLSAAEEKDGQEEGASKCKVRLLPRIITPRMHCSSGTDKCENVFIRISCMGLRWLCVCETSDGHTLHLFLSLTTCFPSCSTNIQRSGLSTKLSLIPSSLTFTMGKDTKLDNTQNMLSTCRQAVSCQEH